MRHKLFLLALIILLSIASVHAQCTYSPQCVPNTRPCGCGGLQTRYTLCDGGCSDWYPCSKQDKELICTGGVDDDCDGKVDCADSDCATRDICTDSDSDSYPASVDCVDSNPQINPGTAEICNNVDDNCNGMVDESVSRECGSSSVGICRFGTETCRYGSWYGCDAVIPKTESCNSLDDDCDGQVDEGCSCQDGAKQRCGSDVGACEYGYQDCVKGDWSACIGGKNSVAEVCDNQLDDDCDGLMDEGCAVVEAAQPEPAKVDEPPSEVASAEPKSEEKSIALPACKDADGDTYGVDCKNGNDCDDRDAGVHPGAAEVCNNIDDNCNDIVDEDLSRGCGVSDVGVCTLGRERCIVGKWMDCDAVFPSQEICGNGLDDNCNNAIDEGCEEQVAQGAKELSSEELALRQYLDLKLGKNYNIDAYLEKYRKTKEYVNIEKRSIIRDGKTIITVKLVPIESLHNLTVFEYIPKFIAHSADSIRFSLQPEIIQADPLVAWHLADVYDEVEISYEVEGEIPNAHQKTSTISFADEITPKVRPWYFDLIPLVLIPIMGFVFVFLIEIAHKRRKQ
jgi:hypothetical protein